MMNKLLLKNNEIYRLLRLFLFVSIFDLKFKKTNVRLNVKIWLYDCIHCTCAFKKTYQVYLIHLHIQIKDHFIYKLQGFLLVKAYMLSIDEL